MTARNWYIHPGKMMKNICLCILLLFVFGTAAHAAEKSVDNGKNYDEAFTLIDVWLDAERDFDRLPGISLAVVEDQETIWAGAYGCANVEDGVPSTPNTIGSICSISKLFTSIAIMKLYEEGKLRLDDRIEDLLPWYNLEQGFADSRPVTVRTMLTHSSGLPREANFPYWIGPYPFPDREQIIAEMSNQQTLYPSSTYFQYSNLAMTLLGEIVAEVSGMTYDEFVYTNIIEPLGLSDTRTELPEDLYGDQLAYGYTVLLRDGTRLKDEFFQANGIKAAAGFSSTAVDLASFASWHLRLLDSDGPEILKPSTLRYMLNVHYTDPGWETTWGLGYSVRRGSGGTKWVGHGGYCPGYQSTLQIHPDSKRAYSVIINANGVSPMKYAMGVHEILDHVSAVPGDSGSGESGSSESGSGESGNGESGSGKSGNGESGNNGTGNESGPDLAEYTGYYLYNHSERYIGTWNGQLVMLTLPTDFPADDMTFFEHSDGDTFYRVRADGSRGDPLEFHRDDDGNIIHYTLFQMHSVRKEHQTGR
ncbi:MAG: serine hydrolase [Balneolaceae bacterium]|nr:MAG: serine hydrolase [Balneolaceae bacterium]